MLREIVLDTETTGLDARKGDRLIEIGCVELINHIPTGKEFHRFINPDGKAVHPDALAIHGLSDQFLADKPLFATVADALLDFLGDAPIIIHNATFDIGFINAELARVRKPVLTMERVIDTLVLARRKHPGAAASLDALCRRYDIDNSKRTKHGALMDSLLLAEVYIELIGQRQATLALVESESRQRLSTASRVLAPPRPRSLPPRLTTADLAAHEAFVATLGPDAIWTRNPASSKGQSGV